MRVSWLLLLDCGQRLRAFFLVRWWLCPERAQSGFVELVSLFGFGLV